MKKTITIICDKDVPVQHLLNDQLYEIYESMGGKEVYTMVSKEIREIGYEKKQQTKKLANKAEKNG